MRFFSKIVFVSLLLLSFAAQAAPRILSLDECIDLALKDNNQIHSNDKDIQLSEAKELETHPRGIPVLKYEHRIAPVPKDLDDAADSFFSGDIAVFNNFKLELGAPITTFGKIKTAQELADIGINASWFQRDKTVSDVTFKIYQIYYGILLARELMELADKAHNAMQDKIEEMNKAKIVDQLGILKLKLLLFEVQRKVEEAKQKEALALSALKVQTGLEQDMQINIRNQELEPINFTIKPLDYYLAIARENRAEYKLLQSGLAAKEKKLKLDKLNYAPNFGWGAFFDIGKAPGVTGEDGDTFTDPFNFTKAGIGLSLKGELDFVKLNAKVKQDEADVLKTIYDKRAAIKGLELEIQQSYLEIKSALSLLQKAREEKKTAQQIVFLTKSNIDIGLGDRKDYLDALQSYLVFQGREYESIYNYNVDIYELKKKIGLLNDPLHEENL